MGQVGTEFEQLVGKLLSVDGDSGTSFLDYIVLHNWLTGSSLSFAAMSV